MMCSLTKASVPHRFKWSGTTLAKEHEKFVVICPWQSISSRVILSLGIGPALWENNCGTAAMLCRRDEKLNSLLKPQTF